jgi:NAD(P)H dehydrogenase (quinone)
MLTGAEIADAVRRGVGPAGAPHRCSPRMFMKAVRVNAKRLGASLFLESDLRHYLPEYGMGTWEVGGPTTHVRDVACVEPEDFLTIGRRYVTGPESRRTAGNLLRQVWNFMLTAVVPMHRLDRFDRRQQHPQPAHPRYAGDSVVWRNEHTASTDPTHDRFGAIKTPAISVSPNRPWDQRLSS